ncbi:hypothetical protein TNCV_2461201 [Trichonephila clavipes]|nr:hypothetical protein TNCV_2461201 [Trichonephila clavipes]
MKIMLDGSRTHTECRHFLGVQLSGHQSISDASTVFHIYPKCCNDTFYTDKVGDMARNQNCVASFGAFGSFSYDNNNNKLPISSGSGTNSA